MTKHNGLRIGWIGAGRMGAALATRLLEAGHDVAVYNRTRSKAEALTGAVVVDSPADLADRDVVFTMVGGSDDFKEVAIGPEWRALAARCGSARAGRLDDDLAGRVRRRARRRRRARHRRARRPRVRQREGRRRRAADDGRVRAGARVPRGEGAARAAGGEGHLRRRRRPRAAGEDLPQPDARRGRADAGRDHGAGREGRRVARRLLRVPQRQRDGLDVHPLQDARVREPGLQADVHAAAAAQGLPARRRRGARARDPDAGLVRRRAGGAGAGRPGRRRTSTSRCCWNCRRNCPGWNWSPRTRR